jgi:RNA polymerase sigma factor (sigma-70 family)
MAAIAFKTGTKVAPVACSPAPLPAAESMEDNCVRLAGLVSRIRSDDKAAMEELYQLFCGGIRFYLCRHLGYQESDDRVHDTFLVVVEAIRTGELREPERVMGFARTVVRRMVAAHIDRSVQERRDHFGLEASAGVVDARRNPEETVFDQEKLKLMRDVLEDIEDRDREILTRFYVYEQSQEQICDEMKLSITQFRLLKSRAKTRFGELGRRRMARRSIARFFLRNS